MHVGMAAVFQNTGRQVSDRQIYLNELALADMAEPLGFDSIWSVEHHFTDYTMCPDVCQFLSYMAGRTKHVKLGSMVVVLPWHDPMRVAEQISMLDQLSGGRFVLGVGVSHVPSHVRMGVTAGKPLADDGAHRTTEEPELERRGHERHAFQRAGHDDLNIVGMRPYR